MAGGNFDINVGKTRPGTYVNVKSKRQQKAKGSTRGIAVIPFVGYDWAAEWGIYQAVGGFPGCVPA